MCGVVCSLSAGMQLDVVQRRADADQNTQAIIYYSLNVLTGTKGDFRCIKLVQDTYMRSKCSSRV